MPKLTVRAIRATPVEIPLNFVLGTSMGAVRAAPLLLIDLETEEGVTGWRQAADLAAVNHVKMSSHLFPEVSAHLLAATPTCHFLEYVDWADVLVEAPLAIVDGHAIVTQRPGHGMVWNPEAVERFRFH
jgi:mandelate racemase